MVTEKLIYASAARKAILKADPKLAYVIDSVPAVDVPKWISVTERVPEKEMEVIVYTGNTLKPSVFCYHFWTADLLSWQSFTHWMPLPKPPKEDE